LVGETGRPLSPEVLARYERIVEDADGLAIQRCARTIRSVDFTEKLRRIGNDCEVPILCVHGDMDIGAPYEASAKVVQEIVPRVEVKIYEKGAHGTNLFCVLPICYDG
jgi:non-heme chloroperoxidase